MRPDILTFRSKALAASRRQAAFTLIELLVVIAIIAMTLYTGDNDEYLASPGWGLTVKSWAHGPNMASALGELLPTQRNFSNQIEKVKTGQLYPFMGTHQVLVCPRDRVEQTGLKKTYFRQRDQKISSYVWNGSVISFSGLSGWDTRLLTHRITAFRPTMILQWEADEMKPFFFNDCSSYPAEGISQRHGGGIAANERVDVKGSGAVGLISGSALAIKYKKFYELAGRVDGGGAGLKDVPNDLWADPNHPRGGAQ